MSWKDTIDRTYAQLRALNKAAPAMAKFNELNMAVKKEGPLDAKTKEFVALGIAVYAQCDSCIALHVKALIRAGATRDEVADVLAMSVQMGGGPASMYAGKALECFDELSDD
ncbi:carboxymuconolactone decarboxylase family protein [Mesobacterium pallidum]|uniref:carboxymuconolactone decarboxylase family protein n=1 Tax=Mesobacterium pallidum TaxID=2872037 RepID=UPI001EE18619|nr:carboxymuconolactone decarboxylase family protein [Mesobacterium pallidum]